jgi:RNA 2',3'-cyclic 3'-phosphodiesterase
MKRTFIAVNIKAGEELVKMVSKLVTELKNESIKWVDINQMHMTLAFLGDTEDETIEQVSAMLKLQCNGFGEINFMISELGVFRNISDPRVIWAGIKSIGKLEDLYNEIKEGLNRIGVKTEERQFNPHLTIGRVKWLKDRSVLERLIEQYKKTIFQESSISEVVLYESILQKSGSLYVPIIIAKLT